MTGPGSVLTLLAALIGALQATAAHAAAEAAPVPRTISVQAYGELRVVPDELTTSFGISAEGNDLEALKEKVDSKLRTLIAYVSKYGVAEQDIRIMQLAIHPQYDYKNGRSLVGYHLQRQVELRLVELDRYGEILDGAVRAGVNHTGQMQLRSSRQQDLEHQAAALAVTQARKKAARLARAAGATVGDVLSIQEAGRAAHGPPRPTVRSMSADAEFAAAPVERVGESIIRQSVHVIFELKPGK